MRDLPTIQVILSAFLVTSYTCVGLLALWASTTPRHWFVRAAVVLAALSPLLFVPAYEPFVVFVLQALVIASGVQFGRWWWPQRSETPPQMSAQSLRTGRLSSLHRWLTGLLLGAVLVAVSAYVVTRLPTLNLEAWTTMVLNGAASGCAVLLGAWMGASERKLVAWPLGLLLCLLLGAIMAASDWFFLSIVRGWFGWPPDRNMYVPLIAPVDYPPVVAWFVIVPLVGVIVGVLTLVWSAGHAGATAAQPQQDQPSGRRAARWVVHTTFVALVVLLAMLPAFVLWQLLNPLPAPHVVLPEPNGYDDLVAAGHMIDSPILETEVEPTSTDELAAEVAKFADVFERIRLGLSRPCQVPGWPTDANPPETYSTTFDALQSLRADARSLMREAELAQQQRRYREAAEISIENIRIGQMLTRDGALVYYLFGLAIEGLGDLTLYRAAPQLDGDACREMIAELNDVESNREPLDGVFYRDRTWFENAYGWHGHLLTIISGVDEVDELPIAQARSRTQAVTRLLMVELAQHAYELEHGAPPKRLQQLVPEFLAEVPADPFASDGSPLKCLATPEGLVPYSVGYDGNDDDGRMPDVGTWDDGDLRLDVFFALVGDNAAAPDEAGDDAAEPTDDSDRPADQTD